MSNPDIARPAHIHPHAGTYPMDIDLERWVRAFNELRDEVNRNVTDEQTSSWIRIHYTAAILAYEHMTREQQALVRDDLEAVRLILESRAH